MSNQISTALEAIHAALQALVVSQVLDEVRRNAVLPSEAKDKVLGMVLEGGQWDGGTFSQPDHRATLLLPLAVRAGAGDPDQRILDAVAEVEGALRALRAAGGAATGGALLESLRWDLWSTARPGEPLARVGAILELTLKFTGPLKEA